MNKFQIIGLVLLFSLFEKAKAGEFNLTKEYIVIEFINLNLNS